jgi:hypothetical protein
MENIFCKLVFASIMIVISWKLMLEPFWESLRDDMNLSRAKKELPVLAKELKLKHRKGDEFGIYQGSWNNHHIRIEPNHYRASICIKSNCDPQFSAVHAGISKKVFHINTLFYHLKNIIIKFIPDYPIVESELPRFSFEDAQLDGYFQERLLLRDGGKDMVHNPEIKNTIKTFVEKNKSIVKDLIIGPEVCCSLWLGGSIMKTRLYSVTGKQVEDMLSNFLRCP